MALLRKFHSRPVGQEGEHPFPSWSSDVYTKKIYTYILTVGPTSQGRTSRLNRVSPRSLARDVSSTLSFYSTLEDR